MKPTLHKLLYVNIITSVETYLSDCFISLVTKENKLIEKFIKTTPEFCDKKYTLLDIIEWASNTKEKVKDYLFEKVIYHNIWKLKNMYEKTLEVYFPGESIMQKMQNNIAVRHDIIHRNGKTKKGETIIITNKEINQCISDSKEFIKYIDEQIKSKYHKSYWLFRH